MTARHVLVVCLSVTAFIAATAIAPSAARPLETGPSPYPLPGIAKDEATGLYRWADTASAGGSSDDNTQAKLASREADAVPEFVGSRWMTDAMEKLANKTLQELTLPGTHDSGSYELGDQLLPGALPEDVEKVVKVAQFFHIDVQDLIRAWGLTQASTIYEQLEAGIRYVDLRAGWDGQAYRVQHTLLGVPYETVLGDVARFVAANPGEVVVVETRVDGGDEAAKQAFGEMLFAQLGDVLYPSADTSLTFTVGDMVAAGRPVLLTVGDATAMATHPDSFFPDGVLFNTYAETCDAADMVAYNNDQLRNFNSPAPDAASNGKLFKLSWILTADAGCIMKGFLPTEPSSLREVAEPVNGAPFVEFLDRAAAAQQRPGNIVLMDFALTTELVPRLVRDAIA